MSSWSVAATKGIEESMRGGAGKALHPGWVPVLSRVPLFQALSTRHLRRVARLAEMKRFSAGEQVVRVGGRGDALYVILDGAPRSATVTAVGVLTTARIARTAFGKLLKEEPAIGVGLAHGLVAIVRDLQSE